MNVLSLNVYTWTKYINWQCSNAAFLFVALAGTVSGSSEFPGNEPNILSRYKLSSEICIHEIDTMSRTRFLRQRACSDSKVNYLPRNGTIANALLMYLQYRQTHTYTPLEGSASIRIPTTPDEFRSTPIKRPILLLNGFTSIKVVPPRFVFSCI